MFFLFAMNLEHCSCFLIKRNSFFNSPSSILFVTVVILLISSTRGLTLLASNLSHASALPFVAEESPTDKVAPPGSRDDFITGNERGPETNVIIDSQEKQNYADDISERGKDFSVDDSKTDQGISKTQTFDDYFPFGVLGKRPWFHSWSGKKRSEEMTWGYGPRDTGVHLRMLGNRPALVSQSVPSSAQSDQKMKGNFLSIKPGSASLLSSANHLTEKIAKANQNYSLVKPKYAINSKAHVEQLIKNVRQENGVKTKFMKFKQNEGFVRFRRSAVTGNKKLLTKACLMLDLGRKGSVYSRIMSNNLGNECILQALELLNQRALENTEQNENQKSDVNFLSSHPMLPVSNHNLHIDDKYFPSDLIDMKNSFGGESLSPDFKDCFDLLNCLHLMNIDQHFGRLLHQGVEVDAHGERLRDETAGSSDDAENAVFSDAFNNGGSAHRIDDESELSEIRNLDAKNDNHLTEIAVKSLAGTDNSQKYTGSQRKEDLSPPQFFLQTYKNILATKSARKPNIGQAATNWDHPLGTSNLVTFGFQKFDTDSGDDVDSVQFYESPSTGDNSDQEFPEENDVISKRPSFHSWSGKRNVQRNSLSKKPSFHSWSGKRSVPENVDLKRPSFHSWSGKRSVPENVDLKRPSFHSWSGKRHVPENIPFKRPSFHSWSGKRNVYGNVITKKPSFHSWYGKRNAREKVPFKRPSFHSWSGKRNVNENTNFKRPSFHSWSGKRDINEFLNYKRPSFHSWSGKRK